MRNIKIRPDIEKTMVEGISSRRLYEFKLPPVCINTQRTEWLKSRNGVLVENSYFVQICLLCDGRLSVQTFETSPWGGEDSLIVAAKTSATGLYQLLLFHGFLRDMGRNEIESP